MGKTAAAPPRSKARWLTVRHVGDHVPWHGMPAARVSDSPFDKSFLMRRTKRRKGEESAAEEDKHADQPSQGKGLPPHWEDQSIFVLLEDELQKEGEVHDQDMIETLPGLDDQEMIETVPYKSDRYMIGST